MAMHPFSVSAMQTDPASFGAGGLSEDTQWR
jgi:hypothetical protein